jgi:hypothetical protein
MTFLAFDHIQVPDQPRGLFFARRMRRRQRWPRRLYWVLTEIGHDPMRYRACLPAIEAGFSDAEAFDLLAQDWVVNPVTKQPEGRIAEFKVTYGNRRGRQRHVH